MGIVHKKSLSQKKFHMLLLRENRNGEKYVKESRKMDIFSVRGNKKPWASCYWGIIRNDGCITEKESGMIQMCRSDMESGIIGILFERYGKKMNQLLVIHCE